jgi:hypothetical protein
LYDAWVSLPPNQKQELKMRKLAMFFAGFVLTVSVIKAQQITGIVKDPQGKPIEKATISLLNGKDSSVAKLAITSTGGKYTFGALKNGQYLVSASHVGFVPVYSSRFEVSGSGNVTVPDIIIDKSTGDMKAVVVTAKKPMVEVKADKTILNVEGTINATGNDALELLRKSPGVMVDKDDNISLAGKNGVRIYIDGKPTPLSGSDLSNYLKSIQSAQIESIELITNHQAEKK